MSRIENNRITVGSFANVPALPGLPQLPGLPEVPEIPEIIRLDASASNASSPSGVSLTEGCMVTGVVKYTHQLAHLINAVRDPERDAGDVEATIDDLCIIPHGYFSLKDPCNLAFLDPSIHTAFDLFAFVAIVPSSSTLDELIQMVKSDNDLRQSEMDAQGFARARVLNFRVPSFTNPQYELIALHPDHFLPYGCPLTVYNPVTRKYKNYVVATDRCFRESENDAPFPPFSPSAAGRLSIARPNVFLVALNAEIKCRRYFQIVTNPQSTRLPEHVLSLMHRTIDLVELLYWRPVPMKGSQGATILADYRALKRKNPERKSRPQGAQTMGQSSEEEDSQILSAPSMRRRIKWPAGMDLEARMAYGRALMSGHDRDYGPEFDDADKLKSSVYVNKANVESWRETVDIEN